MFSGPTIALVVPFLVATSQASVIDVPRDDVVDTQSSIQSLNTGTSLMSGFYDCNKNDDWDCYKRYYQEYNYCHPYDSWCYKDCKNWDEYKDHCYHKDYDYSCYDKCYYGNDDCEKWKECHDYDYDCYKKKHDEHYKNCDDDDQTCYKNKDPYYKKPVDTDYCKPWDFNCHKSSHKDQDYACNPWKDKYCYPYYYPDPSCPDNSCPAKEETKKPTDDIVAWFYSPCEGPCGTNGYVQNIWADGDEHFTEKKDVVVDHIKYRAVKEDEDIRCLPMLSYFPWTPIPLDKYVEKYDQDGFKIRVLHLKEPQVVEVMRCDFP